MQMRHYPKAYNSITQGAAPVIWFGTDAVDGDTGNWKVAPVGSIYYHKPSEFVCETWRKVLDNKRDSDWVVTEGVFAQRVTKTEFTDSGTSGTLVLDFTIPLGAIVTQTLYTDVVAFSGDTTATLRIGDGTDADRYMTGTPSIFTAAAAISAGVPSGTAYHAAAISTVTATIASTADFTNVAADGAVTIVIFYRR